MHLFFLREAWRSLRAHRGLASTAVFSLTAALTLCAMLLLLHHNAEQAMRGLGDRREMIVFLKDEVSESEAQPLIEKLGPLYGQVTYVSRAQAWQEFSDQVGDPELLQAVDQNPLPASLRIKLRPELLNHADMQRAAQQIVAIPGVEDVRYGAEWVRRLDDLNAGLRQGAIAAGAVVALAIAFVLYNTLRLTVLARRPQVEIMSRLGATDRFVATPFVIEAMLLTGLASVLALALVFGLERGLAPRIAGITFLPWTWAAGFVAGAVVTAWLAASLAMTRILRHVGP